MKYSPYRDDEVGFVRGWGGDDVALHYHFEVNETSIARRQESRIFHTNRELQSNSYGRKSLFGILRPFGAAMEFHRAEPRNKLRGTAQISRAPLSCRIAVYTHIANQCTSSSAPSIHQKYQPEN